MMIRELAEFFGAPVLVQFRDAVALAAAGEEKPFVPLDEHGSPSFGMTPQGVQPKARKGFQATEKIEAVGIERLPKFTHTLRGQLVPAPNERVYVVYESDGYIVKTAVRPGDIFAVSSIEGPVNEKSPLA